MNMRTSVQHTLLDQTGAGKYKIGHILVKEGAITQDQLKEAMQIKNGDQALGQENPLKLSSILKKLGHISDKTVPWILAKKYGYHMTRISGKSTEALARQFPYDLMKKHMAFPVAMKSDDTLVLAMAEPTDTDSVDQLQRSTKRTLEIRVCPENEIIDAYRNHYGIEENEYENLLKPLNADEKDEMLPITRVEDFGSIISEATDHLEISHETKEKEELSANATPIIKLVRGILTQAITDHASDIHIEPNDKVLQVRCRKDGALFKSMNLPVTIKNAITSRIKVLAKLKIEEKRMPQDGRIKMIFGKKKNVDLRVSTLPTLYGEKIVMRILDQSNLNMDLIQLGLDGETLRTFKRCLSRPYGMVLVTGPTGSGKTTTLYSALSRLNKEDVNIMTSEDPVEFNIRGINQVNVNSSIGFNHASALKAFLRQDPDIMMIGEVRDLETAEIAVKAAMTGHLVLSTLHTNDSAATVNRLVDMGIPSYLLASSLIMILSQRLVRKLCPYCKKEKETPDILLQNLGYDKEEIEEGLKIYLPKGCEICNGTGYKGRVGLYELMEVSEDILNGISCGLPENQLRRIAIRDGMVSLRRAGLDKIKEGLTSIEEVTKHTVLYKDILPSYLANPEVEIYEDGEIIIYEGAEDKDFFSLVRGELEVFKGKRKVGVIRERGTFFGEIAAITNGSRTATIRASGKSVVKRYPGDKLLEVIGEYPETAKPLFRTMAQRLRDSMTILGRLTAKKLEPVHER
ncbi:MAG: type IV-A pilus assembly ATPase PilB [Proteobacteria bacterium]|nr:type IV-A pilus assembly ATPase PilB [Pseudomonadota bacterium]